MPSRFFALLIVAFWLAMSGVFLVRDLWPRLRPKEPTLYAVELIDEAGKQIDTIGWTVTKNGQPFYIAHTDWAYSDDDDSFRSVCTLWLQLPEGATEKEKAAAEAWPLDFRELRMEHECRIDREERLSNSKTKTTFFPPRLDPREEPFRIEANLTIKGESGLMVPQAVVNLQSIQTKDLADPPPPLLVGAEVEGTPIQLSAQGNLLNPLHPPRRISNVRVGQDWVVPVMDPLALPAQVDPLLRHRPGSVPGEAVQAPLIYSLRARALPETVEMNWEGRNLVCRIIECTGEGTPIPKLRIWVSERDGGVYRHEVTLHGDKWEFARRLTPVLVGRRGRIPIPKPVPHKPDNVGPKAVISP